MTPKQHARCQELALICYPPNSPAKLGTDRNEIFRDAFEAGYQAALADCEARERELMAVLENLKTWGYTTQFATIDAALAKLRGGVE